MEEYEARQQRDNLRTRHTSEEANRDAEGSQTGKGHLPDAPQDESATNRGTNGGAHSPTDLEMTEDRADHPATEAVNGERATDNIQTSTLPSHETTADGPVEEDDDHGEEIIEEAAEDTVIY